MSKSGAKRMHHNWVPNEVRSNFIKLLEGNPVFSVRNYLFDKTGNYNYTLKLKKIIDSFVSQGWINSVTVSKLLVITKGSKYAEFNSAILHVHDKEVPEEGLTVKSAVNFLLKYLRKTDAEILELKQQLKDATTTCNHLATKVSNYSGKSVKDEITELSDVNSDSGLVEKYTGFKTVL